MTIKLTSPVFTEGVTIPKQYTGDGTNISPPLTWTGVPNEAKYLAIICHDPDAPRGDWVHWVLFNLPATVTELPEGVPTKPTLASGARQGVNDSRKFGYSGPYPPPGKPHRYYFNIYALDATLSLDGEVTRAQAEQAMIGHVLASGQLMGRYGR